MGIFGKKKQKDVLKDAVSAVLLQQTNLYQEKSKWGMTFDPDKFMNGHTILTSETVPAGTELTFSVTYRDGRQEIMKATSGTVLCDRLLQMALDPAAKKASGNEQYAPVELQKNQLPNGDYLIGRDIPAGVYDFTWVFGEGQVHKYKNDHDTTLGACNYFEHVGNKQDYQNRQLMNVDCKEGEMLKIKGNVIVAISKSRKVDLDL